MKPSRVAILSQIQVGFNPAADLLNRLDAVGSMALKYQTGINNCFQYWHQEGQLQLMTSVYGLLNGGSEAHSLINWINPAFDADKVGSPVFTADQGWISDGSGYLESNFSPADGVSHLTNMSFHYLTGVEDATPAGTQAIYGVADASNVGHLFFPEHSNAGNQVLVRNFTTAGVLVSVSDTGLIPGFSTHTRTANNAVGIHLNDVNQGGTSAQDPPLAFTGSNTYSILAHNNNGSRTFFFVEPNFKLALLGFGPITMDRVKVRAGFNLYLAEL